MKKKTSKKLAACLALVLILSGFCASAAAEQQTAEELGEEALGQVWDDIPDSAKKYIDGAAETSDSVFSSAWAVIKGVLGDLKTLVTGPLATLGMLIAIIAISAVLSSFKGDSLGGTPQKTVSIVVSLCITAAVLANVLEFISLTKEAIETASAFTLSFIPVFTGLMVSSGQVTSATFFAAGITLMAQAFSGIATQFISPLSGILLGFSAAGGVGDTGIDKISPGIKKVVTWVLGVVATVVVGIMNLQTSISGSSDSLALKTGRYVVGGAVPVVGSSVSEALSTVSASLQVAKGGVGTLGIAGISAVFLPVILSGLLMTLALALAGVFADMLGQGAAAKTIRSINGCVGVNIAVLVCYYIVVVFSLAAVVSAV